MIRENINVRLLYIHTLLFNAFCQRNNLYLSFLTLILRWKTSDVCSGSCALKEWNTDLSDPFRYTVEGQTRFWSVIYLLIFEYFPNVWCELGKSCFKGYGNLHVWWAESYFTGFLWGSKRCACWIWTTSFQPFFYSRPCKDDYILPASWRQISTWVSSIYVGLNSIWWCDGRFFWNKSAVSRLNVFLCYIIF